MRSNVGWSAQCRSSTTSRREPLSESSPRVAVTASKKRNRVFSGSPESGVEGRGVFAEAEDETGELLELPVGHPGDPVRRLGVEVSAERLGEGLERRHRFLVATTPEDERAFVLHGARQVAHRAASCRCRGRRRRGGAPRRPAPPTPTSRAAMRTPGRGRRAAPRWATWGCAPGSRWPSPRRRAPLRRTPPPARPGPGSERAGSWARMACSIHDTSWPGSIPSSVTRVERRSWNTRSASAWRPER